VEFVTIIVYDYNHLLIFNVLPYQYSDKAPTNKIYRGRASSEKRPRTGSCHESERLVALLRSNVPYSLFSDPVREQVGVPLRVMQTYCSAEDSIYYLKFFYTWV